MSDYGDDQNDVGFGTDFNLGVDWNNIGWTDDVVTLPTFEVIAPGDGGGGDSSYVDWSGDTYWGGYDDWSFGNWGITDPLDDIYNVYIPNPTTTPTTPTTTPTTPTATRPPGSTAPAPSPSSGGTSTAPKTSGSATTDIAKLLASILQAFKPTPTTGTTPTGATAPGALAPSFDLASLALVGGGALLAFLVLRKK